MKKRVLIAILIFSIMLVPFLIAQDESVDDKGYSCLEDRVNATGCSKLSAEGKIFALLTLGECKDEILNDNKYRDDLKFTSQAVFAFEELNIDFNNSETIDWIMSKNQTPSDFIWYLQIDSIGATSCTITYDSVDYIVGIGEDKKLDSDAGDCLSLSSGDYWLQIDPSCYETEFEVSCTEPFLTNFLFRVPDDNTIHVSSESYSESGGGTTPPLKINLLCFGDSDCDYRGTLWSTFILDELGYIENIKPFTFYLTSFVEENSIILPEALLYRLTGDTELRDSLIEKQTSTGFWKIGSNKFHDTALALYGLNGRSTQYADAINWLEENQQDSGCWNRDNPTDTAFILFSAWPRGVSLALPGGDSGEGDSEDGEDEEILDCEEEGYFCMSKISCDSENLLDDYSCSGLDRCCSEQEELETCDSLNGDICNSNEDCSGGESEKTSELSYGQTCCVGGSCEIISEEPEETTCASVGGTCRISGCEEGEQESSEFCEFNDKCCVEKTDEPNTLWIWILLFLILIILVIIAIIKRDKLREFWFRLKSKFKKSPPSPPQGARPAPGRMPSTPAAAQRRIMQGRPPTRPMSRRPSRRPRSSGEIGDVLKKLKDMGK